MEWISVDDRMPDEFNSVIICDSKADCQDMRDPIIGHYEPDIDSGTWYRDWSSEVLNVTHWMPLPEPPK